MINFFDSEKTPYPSQVNIVGAVADNQNKSVFSICSPVASGKSAMAICMARYYTNKGMSVGILTPTKILQDQYTDQYPELPSLKGINTYMCTVDPAKSCASRQRSNHQCDDCIYTRIKQDCFNKKVAIFNIQSYVYNIMYGKMKPKDVLIIDEAHNLIDFLNEQNSIKLWRTQYLYPFKATDSLGNLIEFMSEKESKFIHLYSATAKDEWLKKAEKFESIRELIEYHHEDLYIGNTKMFYRGREQELIYIKPFSNKAKSTFLHRSKKVILMSATLNNDDITDLGWDLSNVCSIIGKSNIPPENRKVIVKPVLNMRFGKVNYPKLAQQLSTIINNHQGQKGIIHVTYQIAKELKPYLSGNKRYLFHNKQNKDKKLQQYFDSKDGVLIACGLIEGLDLVGDLGQFQIISKILFPSIADPYNKALKERYPRKYYWQTIRNILQASGRICRTPNDYGITYILDNAFIGLYSKYREFFPTHFSQSLKWGAV